MDEIIQLVTKTYGVVGLLLAAPFVAVYYLWKDNKALRDKLEASQAQRVTDAQSITEKLVTIVGEQSSLNKETNMALERLSDLMSYMQAQPRAR